MQGMLETAIENPWATLEYVLDGPLHPGGTESTAALLERAGVSSGTRLLDVGCGAGTSVSLARERDAEPVGLDHDPPAGGVRGDLSRLPIQTASVDVVLSECVLFLVADRRRAFEEIHRVLAPGGRLALSDLVVEGPVPETPSVVRDTLCLSNAASQRALVESIEETGLVVEDVRDHRGTCWRCGIQSRSASTTGRSSSYSVSEELGFSTLSTMWKTQSSPDGSDTSHSWPRSTTDNGRTSVPSPPGASARGTRPSSWTAALHPTRAPGDSERADRGMAGR